MSGSLHALHSHVNRTCVSSDPHGMPIVEKVASSPKDGNPISNEARVVPVLGLELFLEPVNNNILKINMFGLFKMRRRRR